MIEDTIIYLKNMLNDIEKDFNEVLDFKNIINIKGYKKIMCDDYASFYKPCVILLKYGYNRFMKTNYSLEAYEDMLRKMGNPAFLNIYSKKILKDVNISKNMFSNVDSYIYFMQRLCRPNVIKSIELNDIRDNKTKDGKNLMEILINNPINVFMEQVNSFISKYSTIIEYLRELIFEINNVKATQISNDINQFKICYDKFYSIVSKPKIEIKCVENLKVKLKEEINKINSHEDNSKEEFNNKVKASNVIKTGTRKERMEQYIEQNRKKQLINDVQNLRKKLDEDSIIWINLLVEELQLLDENGIKEFLQNPNKNLPNNSEIKKDIIIKATAMELDYKDADKRIVNTLYTLTQR